MSTTGIYEAGVLLQHYVERLGAENRLTGGAARNKPDYYHDEKGMYDGLAACLEALGDRSGVPSLREGAEDVADQLRRIDVEREDPEQSPRLVQALVYMIGVLMIATR